MAGLGRRQALDGGKGLSLAKSAGAGRRLRELK
jgi:hypothetical protein